MPAASFPGKADLAARESVVLPHGLQSNLVQRPSSSVTPDPGLAITWDAGLLSMSASRVSLVRSTGHGLE